MKSKPVVNESNGVLKFIGSSPFGLCIRCGKAATVGCGVTIGAHG
jgi:hypothetical protein